MKKIDWEILKDYLTGNLSPADKKLFESWLEESNENRLELQRLEKIWKSAQQDFPRPDTAEALKIVLAKINKGTKPSTNTIFKKSYFIRAAAAIIIIAGAALLITNLLTKNDKSFVFVSNNEIQTITMSDGTNITLDAGSNLSYPEDFSDSINREVYLNGEAFFDVTKNKKSNFTVHANNGVITVLGTKFNIRSWKQENEVTVAVEEGKVSLNSNNNNGNTGIVITNGEMSRITSGGVLSVPIKIDIQQYLSWLKREIYFQNTKLKTVLNQLERWYNVNIELRDSTLINDRITVFIENKKLEENLKVIGLLTKLKYEINGNQIILTPEK